MSRQKREGKEIGMCKAIDDLILDGEKRGREQGERIGERRGEKRGEERGQERLARLIVVLSENHKDDLIIKAASDRAFRRKLFKELTCKLDPAGDPAGFIFAEISLKHALRVFCKRYKTSRFKK